MHACMHVGPAGDVQTWYSSAPRSWGHSGAASVLAPNASASAMRPQTSRLRAAGCSVWRPVRLNGPGQAGSCVCTWRPQMRMHERRACAHDEGQALQEGRDRHVCE